MLGYQQSATYKLFLQLFLFFVCLFDSVQRILFYFHPLYFQVILTILFS